MEINMDIIKSTLEHQGELKGTFGEYSKVYLNTTENISGIMASMNLSDKDVLSVAGSGDQALNAYLNGAKTVSVFDINPLSFAITDLKVTGARKLKHAEFCNYFMPIWGEFLEYDTFNRLSKYLSEDTAIYFDYLYSNYTTREIFNKTMYHFTTDITTLHNLNDYLQRDNYERLQKMLEEKDIKYIKSNLTELPEKLDDKYDAILLSNISDSIEDIWNIDTLKCYKRFIHTLSKKLNKEGIIQCAYIYSKYTSQIRKPIIANASERQKVFTEDEFKEVDVNTFVSVSPYDDKVIYFEKKRRRVS